MIHPAYYMSILSSLQPDATTFRIWLSASRLVIHHHFHLLFYAEHLLAPVIEASFSTQDCPLDKVTPILLALIYNHS